MLVTDINMEQFFQLCVQNTSCVNIRSVVEHRRASLSRCSRLKKCSNELVCKHHTDSPALTSSLLVKLIPLDESVFLDYLQCFNISFTTVLLLVNHFRAGLRLL